ncbi:hypothetical protein HHI36_022975 [Cryptolaemus montrouzieri]|uniref:Uncharacterized protein n=1 Tax=Cryptolaemus montrouzieri TaxID=559131 RepID=A0ABD2PEZ2_9CUCU
MLSGSSVSELSKSTNACIEEISDWCSKNEVVPRQSMRSLRGMCSFPARCSTTSVSSHYYHMAQYAGETLFTLREYSLSKKDGKDYARAVRKNIVSRTFQE